MLTFLVACGRAVDAPTVNPSAELSRPVAGDPGANQSTFHPDINEQLVAEMKPRLMTLLDMTSGWSSVGGDGDSDEPESGLGGDGNPCAGDPRIPVPTVESQVNYAQATKGFTESLEIPVDRSVDSAQAVFFAYKSHFEMCPTIIIGNESASVAPGTYPQFGDESVSFRIGGESDIIIARVGNFVAGFAYHSAFWLSAITEQELRQLVEGGVGKLQ